MTELKVVKIKKYLEQLQIILASEGVRWQLYETHKYDFETIKVVLKSLSTDKYQTLLIDERQIDKIL